LSEEEVLRAVVGGARRSSLRREIEEVFITDSDQAPLSIYDHSAFLLAEAVAQGKTFEYANIKLA
jgi:hypothetical protein